MADRFVDPRLFQAGGEILIVGLFQLLLALQVRDGRVHLVHGACLLANLVELIIQDLDLGLDGRRSWSVSVPTVPGLSGARGARVRHRSGRAGSTPGYFSSSDSLGLFRFGDLHANVFDELVLLRELRDQLLVLLPQLIDPRRDTPVFVHRQRACGDSNSHGCPDRALAGVT
jgi:hypothetical protein